MPFFMLELIMNLATYKTLTGINVPSSQESRVSAVITRCQKTLESSLGFTLEETLVTENKYVELGKTKTECLCPSEIDVTNLDAPDDVVCAYRVFEYNKDDKYFPIDPATEIHAVKLVIGNVTVKTLVEFEDYTLSQENGLIRYLEKVECWCSDLCCSQNVQLSVDAEWVWQDEDDIPEELLYLMCDMVTYYSDSKNNIKSETLGPHSYTKFDNTSPELQNKNVVIINKYSGPHSTLKRVIAK
jgi:hypothetical protein